MTETTQTETPADLSGLTAKRDELLAQVKALKARLAEVEAERDGAQAAAAEAEARFNAAVIDRPVDAVLADLFLVPLRHVKPEIEAHFAFGVGDEGAIRVLDQDGNPVMLEGREAQCAPADMLKLLRGIGTLDEVLRGTLASGGGAVATGASGAMVSRKQETPRKVASPFGLR